MGKPHADDDRPAIFLPPGGGRVYAMGRLSAVFKADHAETGHGYSVSEWWLDPNTEGPGPHQNDEDHVWYVIAGTMHVLLGEDWIEAPAGSFVLVPGGMMHTFENRSNARAGLLNINSQAGFEADMPGISAWFEKNPAGDAT